MILRHDVSKQYRSIQAEVLKSVSKVLESGRYVLGKEVTAFEEEFADYIRGGDCITTASGTDALFLLLKAYDIGAGDEVITTVYTAIPTLSAIAASGARPVFVDVDPKTFLIRYDGIVDKITEKTKAIIPVHLFGEVVDIHRIRQQISSQIPIIEDACQAHGSKIGEMKAGALGDAAAFSFYPSKNLGCYGDGGCIITRSEELLGKLKKLRQYGMIDRDHIESHGYNSRLDEVQAAILRVKLKYLDNWNLQRREIVLRYRQNLEPIGFTFQEKSTIDSSSNYHILSVLYDGDRNHLQSRLSDHKIQTNIYYPRPLHLQKACSNLGYQADDFSNANMLSNRSVALPLYPELSESDLNTVIEKVEQIAIYE